MSTTLCRSLLLALLTAGLVHAETFKESSAETHPLSPEGKVRIENENGAITVRTWDRSEASVQVEKSASDPDYLKQIKVEITSEPDSLSIKTTFPKFEFGWRDLFHWPWNLGQHGEVQLTLMVPAGVRLEKISTVNGGLTIEGVRGSIDARTVNGAIRATGLHEGKFVTVNGSVHAEVDRFDAAGSLDCSTVNGSVSVLLPKDVGAGINVSTVNGGVSSDFPVSGGGEKGFLSNRLEGDIGAGGGSIRVRTVNGAVHLQKE